MKKILVALACVAMLQMPSFADDELTVLKQVKKAKISGIKKQIKNSRKLIQNAASNVDLSTEEKEKIYNEQSERLLILYKEKRQIENKYKQEKKQLEELEEWE